MTMKIIYLKDYPKQKPQKKVGEVKIYQLKNRAETYKKILALSAHTV